MLLNENNLPHDHLDHHLNDSQRIAFLELNKSDCANIHHSPNKNSFPKFMIKAVNHRDIFNVENPSESLLNIEALNSIKRKASTGNLLRVNSKDKVILRPSPQSN